MSNQKLHLLLLIGLSTIALSGCGASKVGGSNQSEDLALRGPTESSSINPGALTECSRTAVNDLGLTVYMQSYFDYRIGAYSQDRIKGLFIKTPSNVTISDHYINVLKWKHDDGQPREVGPSVVKMLMFHKASGRILNDDAPLEVLSRNTIQKAIVDYNLAHYGVSESTFFDEIEFIFLDVDYQWDALTFALYSGTSGATSYGQAEGLMPPFSADPNVYSQLHSSLALQQLHPNHSMKNSGASEDGYLSLTQSFCF